MRGVPPKVLVLELIELCDESGDPDDSGGVKTPLRLAMVVFWDWL